MRRRTVSATSFLAIGALFLAHNSDYTPQIMYNTTASVPVGFYLIGDKDEIKVGDLAAMELTSNLQKLAEERQYIGPGIPFLKHIMALKGDTVCRENTLVSVNGISVATTIETDSKGREMPVWQGCYVLKPSEFFALNPDVQTSFDGRYFGILSANLIIGKAKPLWIFGGEEEVLGKPEK